MSPAILGAPRAFQQRPHVACFRFWGQSFGLDPHVYACWRSYSWTSCNAWSTR